MFLQIIRIRLSHYTKLNYTVLYRSCKLRNRCSLRPFYSASTCKTIFILVSFMMFCTELRLHFLRQMCHLMPKCITIVTYSWSRCTRTMFSVRLILAFQNLNLKLKEEVVGTGQVEGRG